MPVFVFKIYLTQFKYLMHNKSSGKDHSVMSDTDINHFICGKPRSMSIDVVRYLKSSLISNWFIHILLGTNILLDEDENVKLADFGLSKIIQVQFYDI